jgi:hypothetical protein
LGADTRLVGPVIDSGGFFVEPVREDTNFVAGVPQFIDEKLQVCWFKPKGTGSGGTADEICHSKLQRSSIDLIVETTLLVIPGGTPPEVNVVTGVAFELFINGVDVGPGSSFTAKTFVIDHPKDPENKYLVHGCLEGPESGVYYRGTAKVTDNHSTIVALPDYVPGWAKNFTVTVTAIYDGKVKMYATSKVDDSLGQFTVYGENGEFNWIAVGQRAEIKVEPLKSETTAKGFGPYRWIE